jgi:acetolactate synthase-1/2/3 large subunit
MKKVSDCLTDYFVSLKVEKVFCYIGGMITHITDSISKNKEIELINMINEQGVGFAAEGYSRALNHYGVAIATSGPGATNLITPIASCYFDSVPVVFITGQVNTYEYKYDKKVRQQGFQETNIVDIVKPIVKYAKLVDKADEVRFQLEKAFFVSNNSRKGPVLLDIPMDIQRTMINWDEQDSFFVSKEYLDIKKNIISVNQIKDCIKSINSSTRPIILVGGGLRSSDAIMEIKDFLIATKIPVVHSLLGKDAVSAKYKYNLGLIGSYGDRSANMAVANSDLIIVLGSRLDLRQIGTRPELFAREAKIIRVDIDENELDFKIEADLRICAEIKYFIRELLNELNNIKKDFTKWRTQVLDYKLKFSNNNYLLEDYLLPNNICYTISKYSKSCKAVVADVGQHQMWMAQSYNLHENQRLFFSAGLGAMGFALPAAIEASIALKAPVLVVVGDGGMQMNIQELEVIKRRKLPIKIVVLNNRCLGMVREFQEIYFDKNYVCTDFDYSSPEFTKVANAYGISSVKVNSRNFNKEILNFFRTKKSELMEYVFKYKYTKVVPKLIVNKPIEDMYPFLTRKEFLENMIVSPLKESIEFTDD